MTNVISYAEAKQLHPKQVEEIVQQLRSSKARDKDLPEEKMRWEYFTTLRLHALPHTHESMTRNTSCVLWGRAWHWTGTSVIRGYDDTTPLPTAIDQKLEKRFGPVKDRKGVELQVGDKVMMIDRDEPESSGIFYVRDISKPDNGISLTFKERVARIDDGDPGNHDLHTNHFHRSKWCVSADLEKV